MDHALTGLVYASVNISLLVYILPFHKNACEEDRRCGVGTNCMRLGGETRMSRECGNPNNRRVCGK